MAKQPLIVDALQYSNWSEKIFYQMNQAGVAAAHVTICYHEDFKETVKSVPWWVVTLISSRDIRNSLKDLYPASR